MTSLLLKDNCILYSQNNEIRTSKLKSTIPFDFDLFYSDTEYKTFVERFIKSTESLPSFEKLIINNDYYNHFGLIEQLEKNDSIKQKIIPEYDVEINTSNSNYKIVDVTQTTINVYSIQDNVIVGQNKIDVSEILIPLFNNLKDVCITNEIKEFKKVFFDYKINCETYNWLKDDGYTFEDLKFINFNKGLNQLFPNIDLKRFFELVHESISTIIDINFENEVIVFKSPFTNYTFLNSINTNNNIQYIDEFNLLLNPINTIKRQKLGTQNPKIELFLNNKTRTWVLLDETIKEISIENKKILSLNPIIREIKKTSFNVGKNKFIKLRLETKTNFFNKSCLSINTLDTQHFYKLLN